MRVHRFYTATPIKETKFDITDRDMLHQWKSVFRYNVGSQVILFDGSGVDYLCMITSIRNLGATVEVIENKEVSMKRNNVYLCMAMIKKDNFELVTQKVTEIGVTHIIPILCEHSEKKKLNMERLNKIVLEASEQSGRGDIPTVHDIQTLEEVFQKGILPQEKTQLGARIYNKYR
jgi:16S rRNA (uracil1498-N3)-methyltransferase